MIELTINDGVAEVMLRSPEILNALDERDLDDLSAVYEEAEAEGVRALLLHAEGRAFCAGRDISDVDAATDDVLGFLESKLQPLLEQMSSFPAPTFAAAHGACVGVGLGLLIATDVVYVAESAKIGSPFAHLGAVLDSGGHSLFVERLGAHRTLDLVYSGRLMRGDEAVAAGLFSQVFPDDDVLDAARQAAIDAANGPTQALLASKRIVQQLRDERLGLWASIAKENIAQANLAATDDYREGFSAFQQKRTPRFRGH